MLLLQGLGPSENIQYREVIPAENGIPSVDEAGGCAETDAIFCPMYPDAIPSEAPRSAVVVTEIPIELPYVAGPIVKPVSVMPTVASASIVDSLDNVTTMLVEDGAAQVANTAESFTQTLGAAETAKNPNG